MQIEKAQELAIKLMTQHGLMQTGWGFRFDRATLRGGACHFRTKVISVSRSIAELNTEAEIRNTILHEIAHALAGAGHGHDKIWAAMHRSIGGNGKTTHNMAVPPKPYQGICPKCHRTKTASRRSKGACARCCRKYNHGRYSEQFVWVWGRNPELAKTA